MKKRPIRIMILYWSRKKSHARSTIRIPYRIFSVELTRNSQKNSYKIWHHWQETDSVDIIMNGNGEGTRCWPAAIVMVAVRVNAEALFNNLFFFSFVRSLLFSFLFFSSFFFWVLVLLLKLIIETLRPTLRLLLIIASNRKIRKQYPPREKWHCTAL